MTTPNLNIDHIAEGQTNKETTANAAFDALDGSMNSVLELAITGDVVLTTIQFRGNQLFHLTGTPGSPFYLTVPGDIKKAFSIFNATDADVLIELEDATSDASTVAAGSSAILHSIGTAIFDVGGGTGSGGGSGGTTITIEDEGGTVTAPTRINFVGSGVNASENSDGTVDILIPGGRPTTIIEETGDFTLTDAHLAGNVIIEANSAGAISVFIETGLTGIEPVTIIQAGAGTVTVVDDSAVSLVGKSGASTTGREAAFSIVPRGSDNFRLIGDLE